MFLQHKRYHANGHLGKQKISYKRISWISLCKRGIAGLNEHTFRETMVFDSPTDPASYFFNLVLGNKNTHNQKSFVRTAHSEGVMFRRSKFVTSIYDNSYSCHA